MLEKLSSVQDKDLELDALNAEKSQTPQELLDTEVKRDNLERRLADKRAALAEVRKEIRANEMELSSLQARRKSATESALMATSTKEASQYQNQELQFATRVEELESDTLPVMERAEVLQAEVEALEAELGEVEPLLQSLNDQENLRVSAIDDAVTALAGERDALTEGIDKTLLKQYEHVRRSKRGIGLAAIVDGARCSGCNVRLPLHVVQKVKAGKGVTRCPSCGRILWLASEPTPS